jgi:archaellum component FlaC
MATRMQQRRGTAAQWTAANPVLGAGEIGFETDTNKFKIGNGSTAWTSLSYFVDGNAVIDGAPELLNTLNELAAALGDDPSFFTTVANNLSSHESDTTNVHGIADTSLLVTTTGTQTLSNKTLTTPTINGPEITATGGTPRLHGAYFPDGHAITFEGATTNEFETILNVIDPTADRTVNLPDASGTVQLRVTDVSDTEIGYLNGVTSAIQTQIDAKAPLASPALTGTPTAPTATAGNNSTQVATTAYADAAVAALVDSAPAALNTLNELAQALNDDSDFAVTITNSFASVQNTINGLGNTISSQGNSINVLEGNVVSIANTLSVTQNGLSTTSTVVDGLTNSVSTINGNITSLQNSLTNTISDLSTHMEANTSVHGISNVFNLASLTDLSTHAEANTSVHGISNTLNLVYTNDSRLSDERTPVSDSVTTAKIANAAVTGPKIAENAISQSHLSDDSVGTNEIGGYAVTTGKIANAAVTSEKIAEGAITKTMVGLSNVDNTSDADKPVSSATQTALDAKASLAGATFTGSVEIDQDLTVDGNFIVNGSNVLVSATQIQIEDTLLQLGHTNANNITDLGLIVGYNDGSAKHAGIVKDVTDGKWKLFKDLTVEPATTVDFSLASLDILSVGTLESANGVAFSDGTQAKEGVPSRTPIISKTASYTLSAESERDSLIEVSSESGTTITIPLNSAVAYPVGTTLDILQTNTGQVTIAGDAGVTVNATPGLKLRTQWSSATLFKRDTNAWVVFGDLSA